MIESGKIVVLVICMVFLCGCTAVNPQQFNVATTVTSSNTIPVVTATPTKPPVTPANIIPTIITPVPTIIPTPAPTATTRAPRMREPTPTPVPTMNVTTPYLKYEDTDFKVEYPSNWTVETSTVATTRNRLNEQMRLTGDTRQVVFNGGNQSIVFVVTTADLLVPGSEVLKPDINLVSDMVTLQFDDVSGWNAVSNYGLKYTAMYKTPMVQFDVIIPSSSKSYPLTYTERDFVSYSHFYSMRFTTPGNPEDYKEIIRHIFDTLQTEEIIKV
jgi:hypothetical protein